jgi:hypothetical protein
MRIANREAAGFAAGREPFENNNRTLFGSPLRNDDYVVYSYGTHWPLYVWLSGRWFENEESYSSTTSRHRIQARPTGDTKLVSRKVMLSLASIGYTETVQRKLLGEQL